MNDATRSQLAVETNQLQAIASLAMEQLDLERELAEAEEELAVLKRKLNRIKMDLLPEALEDAGLTKFTLASGHEIRLTDDYQCSLAGKYLSSAINWLKNNGYESMISQVIVETFSPSDQAEAERVKQLFRDLDIEFQETSKVNTNTFKALVKDLVNSGQEVPIADLGVTVIRQTKISAPKQRRSR